ncbi:hypothetical protein C1645_739190 [Glomus cerebriforme]|uniref:Uncharacterized protein n=1 Tax=Glomus cerebriforme TaxID=658196 RepID=A0A397SR82_9GLOM|nr:hypothetical protein C1645_739190 [Glomus cerebriforme]
MVFQALQSRMGRKNGSLNSSVQNGKGKQFFELFSLEWEGKMVFSSMLELKMKHFLTILFLFLWTLLQFGHLELGNGVFLISVWKSVCFCELELKMLFIISIFIGIY